MPIPNRYYEKVQGLTPTVLQNIAPDNHIEPITDKVRQVDWHGGFTAASNCSIYTARTYPREYWNRTAFISEPTGHLTATMTLRAERHELHARGTAGTSSRATTSGARRSMRRSGRTGTCG